ncbi:MAG: M16 family metallopeptidase [Chitinophagaceae bacterium]
MQETTILNRKVQPPIKDAIDFNLELKPCQRFTLDNGVEVYAIDAGAEEVLQLEMVFFAGNWYEEKNGIAAATNFLLKNGTSNRTAFEISEHFDYFGAYLNRNCYNETANFILHCLTKRLGDLLPVMQEILTDAAFPEHELDIYKQNMKQRLEVNLKKCDVVANRNIDELIYGPEHPYGKNNTLEMFDLLTTAEIKQFYQRYYSRGKCIIFVAGILPLNLASLLNEYFGKLPLNKQDLPDISFTTKPAKEKKQRIINDPDGVQGAIRLARNFPNRHHPDFKKAQVLNTLFGGFFGSRLMDNIREDKGYTYGIHSYIQNHLQDTAWVISTEAGRDVCEATVSEIYKEMKRLREGEIPAVELLMVKNYLMGSILGDLDGPFQIIGRWKNLVLNGLDESFFNESVQTIRSVKPEELTELACKYFTEDAFYELVVV